VGDIAAAFIDKNIQIFVCFKKQTDKNLYLSRGTPPTPQKKSKQTDKM